MAGYFCFGKSNISPAPAVLRRVTFCGDKKSPKSAFPSLVRYADTLTLQTVRGFADGTSMYRGKRSSSLTRPLRGLILTVLQGLAATQGMKARNIVPHSEWLNVSLTRRVLMGMIAHRRSLYRHYRAALYFPFGQTEQRKKKPIE